MKLRIIVITVLTLSMISCGKSDDNADADKASTASEVAEMSATLVTDEDSVAEIAQQVGLDAKPDEESADQDASISTGESVYNKACMGCHLAGAASAPKLGDKIAWADRIAKGTEALVQSAIKGVPGTAMMARGTCNSCTDDEIKAAVDYMITQSQ